MTQEAAGKDGVTTEETLLEHAAGEEGGGLIRERYGLALTLLFVGYVLSGFENKPLVVVLNSLLWVALLLAALWSPGIPRRLRQLGLVATALLLVTSAALGLLSSDTASGWAFFLFAIAQLAALLAILSRVMRHATVTLQTVMGGVAGYALIAFVMASVYHGADLLSNTTFLNGVVNEGDYTYFSFVTLTTVGYGDITAASEFAKRLVVVEAFVGQAFLITLVARLVSMWGRRPES